MSESDPTKLAELVLENAKKMKCRKFVRVKDIIKGNAKLNLAFVCNLFNNFPALEPAEEELPNLEETREEKTFRNWMNSMGVRPFVHNLFLDLDDGCVLLQLFELVSIDFVPRTSRSAFKRWRIDEISFPEAAFLLVSTMAAAGLKHAGCGDMEWSPNLVPGCLSSEKTPGKNRSRSAI